MSQATDPVCGRVIELSATTDSLIYEEQLVYFCSDECRGKFEESPEQYEVHEPPYTIKGGITAPKFGSAASGGLEYEPVPERHVDKPGKRKK